MSSPGQLVGCGTCPQSEHQVLGEDREVHLSILPRVLSQGGICAVPRGTHEDHQAEEFLGRE